MTAKTYTDITIAPDSEWAAIHYPVVSTNSDPKVGDWETAWTAAFDRLSDVTLNDTLCPQTMEPAKRTTQLHHSTAKQTIWHYLSTIHSEAVSKIKEALSLELQDTPKAQ